jgi:aminoglycoside/choline kinase family phosphotransferase
MDLRFQQLNHWLLTACQLTSCRLEPMAGDASFRRYYRVWQDEQTFVAMDAPPARETNTRALVTLTNVLADAGLCVPEVIVSDIEQGFLLLTDFGDRVYLPALTTANADELYGNALSALSILQACEHKNLPAFSKEFMFKELQNFKEWFLLTHLKLNLSSATEQMLENFFYFLAEECASQPQVFMHRDYQSANLMVLPDAQVGILDFQDAFSGPLTYDLVSLLRDCYIVWPPASVTRWALQYKASLGPLADISDEVFIRWFDIMGMQRHLKALLTFSRKYQRDANANYLQHIPRTINYVLAVAANYPQGVAFHQFLTNTVVPQLAQVTPLCVE